MNKWTMTLLTLTLSALPLASMNTASAARNTATYDLACLHNDTNRTIYFSYLGTGDDGWQDASVSSGRVFKIWWTNDPVFHSIKVRFDSDMSSDDYYETKTIYPDDASALNCDVYGSDYTFDWDFGDYIDLFNY